MTLLQRYVLSQLFKTYAVVLTGATVLLVCIGVFGIAKEHNLGLWAVAQILPYVAPSLLPFTIPAMLLLAVCVTYGRMAGDREIIAAKAAGVNVLSIIWPSYALAAAMSAAALVLVDQTIPWSMDRIERIVAMQMENIILDILKTQNQYSVREQGLSISVMDVVDRRLIMPTFRYARNGRRPFTIMAREAKLDFDMKEREVVLQLVDAEVDIPTSTKSADGSSGTQLRARRPPIRFPLPSKNSKPKTRAMPVASLLGEVDEIKSDAVREEQRFAMEAGFALATGNFRAFDEKYFTHRTWRKMEAEGRRLKLLTEMHSRYSLSASCFFFVLFGSPFAIWQARPQFLTSFLFCFSPILVVYYPLVLMVQNLGKSDQLNAMYGSWIPNAVLAVAALWVFPRVLRN